MAKSEIFESRDIPDDVLVDYLMRRLSPPDMNAVRCCAEANARIARRLRNLQDEMQFLNSFVASNRDDDLPESWGNLLAQIAKDKH